MANKAKHAFGSEAKIQEALAAGTIDAYDILFLDEKKVGWITKDGEVVIAEGEKNVIKVTELPTTDGKEDVVYIFENQGYIWDSTQSKCIPLAQDVDVTTIEEKVTNLETAIETKVDEKTVDDKIEAALTGMEIVEF